MFANTCKLRTVILFFLVSTCASKIISSLSVDFGFLFEFALSFFSIHISYFLPSFTLAAKKVQQSEPIRRAHPDYYTFRLKTDVHAHT